MERSITPKGQASRARLLQAAATEFAAKGFAATKVSDIVKAAGLTQAAFYLYFSSKEAMFAELVQEFREQLKHLASAGAIASGLPAEQVPVQVKANLQAVFAFLGTMPELTKIALVESPDAEAIKSEMIAMVIENMKKNQEAGYVRKELVPEVAAECMMGMVDRLCMKWLVTQDKDAETLAAEMADVLMYGILA
ncbi:TetR/AcrR family transcriptional regulator [Brevibacillus fluminis]|uniref:TetR/AcrR family transcriptional regulator n=1 Tax=Brevibacillus fluminis TaxID=511487 RepID=A0A3M8D9B0_9BACL|nr:TetR/AcrR family transcriptional regulator [Brevibacillus fluminis]RNB84538.1 TetR/AcrR family transcriptional regulator [Brevibacillus fluminis]